jgi:hypothetical protein
LSGGSCPGCLVCVLEMRLFIIMSVKKIMLEGVGFVPGDTGVRY